MDAGLIFEPGFQLSFAAVAAIFLLVPRLGARLEGYPLPAWLREALAISTACGVGDRADPLAPVRHRPVYSLLANVARDARDRAAARARARSARCSSRSLPSVALAARVAERLARRLHRRRARGSSAACRSRRSAPGSAVSRSCSACRCARSAPARLPRWRRPLALACSRRAAACAPRLAALPARAPAAAEGLRLTVLDVGQGDAILLQVPRRSRPRRPGPAGGARRRQLRELGIRRLAALVLTHPPARPHRRCERPSCGGSASSACSTRGSPARAAYDDAARSRRPPSAGSRSSRRGPERPSGSAGSASASSGPTAPGRRGKTRTALPSCSSRATARSTRS